MYKRGTAAHTQVDWLKRSFVLLTTRNTQRVVTQRGKPHTLRACVCVRIHSIVSWWYLIHAAAPQPCTYKMNECGFFFIFLFGFLFHAGEVKRARAKKCKTVLFTRGGWGGNVTWTVKMDLMELFHRADDKTPTYIIKYMMTTTARGQRKTRVNIHFLSKKILQRCT